MTKAQMEQMIRTAHDLLAIVDEEIHSDRLADIVLLLEGQELGRPVYS